MKFAISTITFHRIETVIKYVIACDGHYLILARLSMIFSSVYKMLGMIPGKTSQMANF